MSSPTTPQTVADLGFDERALIKDVDEEIPNNHSDSIDQEDQLEHIEHAAPFKPARPSLPTPDSGKGKAAARTETHIGPAAAKPDLDVRMTQHSEVPPVSPPPGMTYSPGPESPNPSHTSFAPRNFPCQCRLQPVSSSVPSVSQQDVRERTPPFGRPLPPVPLHPALSKHNEPSSKSALYEQQTSHKQAAHGQASCRCYEQSVDKGVINGISPFAHPQPRSHEPHALQETVPVKHYEPSKKSASHEHQLPREQRTSQKQAGNTHSTRQRSEQAVGGELIGKIPALSLSDEYKHQEPAAHRSSCRPSSYGEHAQLDRQSERSPAESRRRATRHSLDDAEYLQTRSQNTHRSSNSAVPAMHGEGSAISAAQHEDEADNDYDHLPDLNNELYDGYRESRTTQQELVFQSWIAAEASAKIMFTIGGVVYEAARSSEARRMASNVAHQVRTVSREAVRVVATETPLYEFVGAIPGLAVDAVQWSMARSAQISDALARTNNGEPQSAITEDATESPGNEEWEEWEEVDAEDEVFQKSIMPESNNDLDNQSTPPLTMPTTKNRVGSNRRT